MKLKVRCVAIPSVVLACALLNMSARAVAQTNADDEVYTIGNGITSPVPTKKVSPSYTQAARDAKIEGTVLLRAVVRRDGTVDNIAVERSLDAKLGLDDAAIAAARLWSFEPARRSRDKQPVSVRVTIEMAFTLKK
jgi:protein TonB